MSRLRSPRSLRPRRRALVAALLAAVCALAALSGCSSSSGAADTFQFTSKNALGTLIPVAKRKPAEDISGSLLSGGSTTLVADKGHVTVLNWWASWCGPCKVETPQLELLYQQVKSKGVDFLGIDTKDDAGDAKTFISQNNISYPIIYDQQAKTQLKLGNIPGVLPFTVLIDKQGRVAAVYIDKVSPKDLQGPLTTLLAES